MKILTATLTGVVLAASVCALALALFTAGGSSDSPEVRPPSPVPQIAVPQK